MQGLTATDKAEAREMIDLVLATDAGTGVCHEGFDANNPARFTREWFAWANSLFAELVYETYLK
jgi:meiotically up-regulated gene 157 (Mug157) protein